MGLHVLLPPSLVTSSWDCLNFILTLTDFKHGRMFSLAQIFIRTRPTFSTRGIDCLVPSCPGLYTYLYRWDQQSLCPSWVHDHWLYLMLQVFVSAGELCSTNWLQFWGQECHVTVRWLQLPHPSYAYCVCAPFHFHADQSLAGNGGYTVTRSIDSPITQCKFDCHSAALFLAYLYPPTFCCRCLEALGRVS